MTPTKLLIGQILIVFAIVILGVWAATQWAAAMLGYQPELGAPWLRLGGLPVYRPWDLFPWWYHYEAYAPHVFDKAGSLAAASGFIGCGAAIGGSLWRAGRRSARSTPRGCAATQAYFSGACRAAICAMTAPSMSWRSRRREAGRASASSSRPCSAGPARRLSLIHI